MSELSEAIERYEASCERVRSKLENPFSILYEFDDWFRYELAKAVSAVRMQKLVRRVLPGLFSMVAAPPQLLGPMKYAAQAERVKEQRERWFLYGATPSLVLD